LEIAAFDELISAEKALGWGLATKVVPDSEVVGETVRMVEQIADSNW
jgi:2-(1,2-epoxy-1,2-dihydrophenyl)acetyl-CoA isomerase